MANRIVRIESITIENFKNVTQGTLDFENKRKDYKASVLGLYGQNGSGKTALIDAIELLKLCLCGKTVPVSFADHVNIDAEYALVIMLDESGSMTDHGINLLASKSPPKELNTSGKTATAEYSESLFSNGSTEKKNEIFCKSTAVSATAQPEFLLNFNPLNDAKPSIIKSLFTEHATSVTRKFKSITGNSFL